MPSPDYGAPSGGGLAPPSVPPRPHSSGGHGHHHEHHHEHEHGHGHHGQSGQSPSMQSVGQIGQALLGQFDKKDPVGSIFGALTGEKKHKKH